SRRSRGSRRRLPAATSLTAVLLSSPSLTAVLLSALHSPPRSSRARCGEKLAEARRPVPQVQADPGTVPPPHRPKVPERLGQLETAQGERLPGNRHVPLDAPGDLQEDPGGRPSLVVLA